MVRKTSVNHCRYSMKDWCPPCIVEQAGKLQNKFKLQPQIGLESPGRQPKTTANLNASHIFSGPDNKTLNLRPTTPESKETLKSSFCLHFAKQ